MNGESSLTQRRIKEECDYICNLLIEKNKCYGDSAFQPINVFSNATALQQIDIRIDDKLNRIKKGSEYPGEDTILDLIGYLVLRRVVSAMEEEKDERRYSSTSDGLPDTYCCDQCS